MSTTSSAPYSQRTAQKPSPMAYQRYSTLHPDRPGRPHVARHGHHPGPALVRGRPARRQPGPDRPDDPGPQEAHVRAAGPDGLQGDRGRLPVGQPDGLRLRPRADRGRPDPRRRRHPGPDPVPRAPDRAHLRVDPRGQAGDRAPVQLDLHAAAPGGVRPGQGRDQGHRRARRAAVHEVRRADHPRHRHLLRVLPRVLHGHRAGVRRRGLQRRQRRVAAHPGAQGHHQPAGDRRDGHAQRLRRLDRVDAPQPAPPRLDRPEPAPAQRPRHRRGRRRAGLHGRRGPDRGLPVRQRRAHRQRLPGDPGHEPVQPGHRPADRLPRHRRDPPHGRVLQPAEGARAPPVRRRPGVHRVLRLAPGRDQQGLQGDGHRRGHGRASRSSRSAGRSPTCRSTRTTSAARTRPSSGSTASPARAAWPTSCAPSTAWSCRGACRSSSPR